MYDLIIEYSFPELSQVSTPIDNTYPGPKAWTLPSSKGLAWNL